MTRRYVHMPTAQKLRGHVEWVAEHRHNLLVTGPAGIGKTEALRETARCDPRAAMITIAPAMRSMLSILSMVAGSFGMEYYGRSRQNVAWLLQKELAGHAERGRYLIVDEAQMLPADAMRQILSYSDHPEWPLPVIFAGNEHTLKRTNANAAAYDQIRSRVAKHVQVTGILPGDVDEFCVDWDVVGPGAYELMRAFGAGRSCREIDKLLTEARRLGGPTEPIRAPAIRDAMTSLHGQELARKFSREDQHA